MYTLVIHAPFSKVRRPYNSKSFYWIVRKRTGDGYAIGKTWGCRLTEALRRKTRCRVVVLDKHYRLRAEGTLARLRRTKKKTRNNVQRYDVIINRKGLQSVNYTPGPRLNGYGVYVR
jgi:hypothetical protein